MLTTFFLTATATITGTDLGTACCTALPLYLNDHLHGFDFYFQIGSGLEYPEFDFYEITALDMICAKIDDDVECTIRSRDNTVAFPDEAKAGM